MNATLTAAMRIENNGLFEHHGKPGRLNANSRHQTLQKDTEFVDYEMADSNSQPYKLINRQAKHGR